MMNYTINSSSRLPLSRKHWTQISPAIALSREFYALTLQARDRAITNPKIGHLLKSPREFGAANVSLESKCPVSQLPLECRLDYWAPEKSTAIHVVLCDRPKTINSKFINKLHLPLIEAFSRHTCAAALNTPLKHFYFLIVNAQGPGSVTLLELEHSLLKKGKIDLQHAVERFSSNYPLPNDNDPVDAPVVHLSDWGKSTYKTPNSIPSLIYDLPTQHRYFQQNYRTENNEPNTLARRA